MIIEKNGNTYIVTEHKEEWTVKADKGKLSIVSKVSKELCSTEEKLREYILNNNEIFQESGYYDVQA